MSGRERNERKRGSTENGAIDEEAEFQGPNSKPSMRRDEDTAKKPKIAMGFSKKPADLTKSSPLAQKGIQMKLGGQPSVGGDAKRKPSAVAAAFNDDSDSEPEEMPPEAKMRMRNIGRETPTSAGPNSFGKTKQGFCDAKKVFEKNLKQAQDSLSGSKAKS